VVDALEKEKNESDIIHARRTAYWIKQLKSDADEALLIAGIAHYKEPFMEIGKRGLATLTH